MTLKLSQLKAKAFKFEAGDRILVKIDVHDYFRLSEIQINKVRHAVQKWAGDHVEVLVLPNNLDLEHIPKSPLIAICEKSAQ